MRDNFTSLTASISKTLSLLALLALLAYPEERAQADLGFEDIDCETPECLFYVDGEMTFCTGYRWDKLTTTVQRIIPPPFEAYEDHLSVKAATSWQAGLKGRFTAYNWMGRLEGDYGWINQGTYRQNKGNANSPLIDASGKIPTGNTADLSIGFGYLYPITSYFKVGPVLGLSYSYLKLMVSSRHTAGEPLKVIKGLKYRMDWQGPWFGVDATYLGEAITVNAGYEYHWGTWFEQWILEGHQVGDRRALADEQRSRNAWANVAYVEGYWDLNACWYVGAGFKYKRWRTINGFEDISQSSANFERGFDATWQSLMATFEIGYSY